LFKNKVIKLEMVAETDLYWLLSVMLFLESVGVKRFFENDSTNPRQFFSEFRRKHLLIKPFYEKHCTRPLRGMTIG